MSNLTWHVVCERRFGQVMTYYMRGVRKQCHKWTDWARAWRARTNREAYRRAWGGSGIVMGSGRCANNGRIKCHDARLSIAEGGWASDSCSLGMVGLLEVCSVSWCCELVRRLNPRGNRVSRREDLFAVWRQHVVQVEADAVEYVPGGLRAWVILELFQGDILADKQVKRHGG